jgi:hypothetical protein
MRPKIRITNYYEFDGVYAFKADHYKGWFNVKSRYFSLDETVMQKLLKEKKAERYGQINLSRN